MLMGFLWGGPRGGLVEGEDIESSSRRTHVGSTVIASDGVPRAILRTEGRGVENC